MKKNPRDYLSFKAAITALASTVKSVNFRLALISFIIAIIVWAYVKQDIISNSDATEPKNSLPAFQKE